MYKPATFPNDSGHEPGISRTSQDIMTATPGPLFALALASISLIGPLAVHLVHAGHPGGEGRARPVRGDGAAHVQHRAVQHGVRHAGLRLAVRPLRPAAGAALRAFACFSSAAQFRRLRIRCRPGRRPAGSSGRRRLRHHAGARHRAGRLRPARLVKAIAYLTMAYTIGPMVAPMVGGILIDAFGWRSVFCFALVAGGIIIGDRVSRGVRIAAAVQTRPTETAAQRAARLLDAVPPPAFTAFVLQSGFAPRRFWLTATAASSLMKECCTGLRPNSALYFLLFPVRFSVRQFHHQPHRHPRRQRDHGAGRIGAVLLTAVARRRAVLLTGYVTPLTLFAPGFFISLAQGISLSYAQAGAHGDQSETCRHRGRTSACSCRISAARCSRNCMACWRTALPDL